MGDRLVLTLNSYTMLVLGTGTGVGAGLVIGLLCNVEYKVTWLIMLLSVISFIIRKLNHCYLKTFF